MRALIIEDDTTVSDFLKSSLEAEYFAVDVEADGEKGLFLAKTNDYDIIILDNNLPGIGGSEICKSIRNEKMMVPILVLSVRTETNIKTELLNLGADDYLNKPFSFQELLARIRALLRRPQQIQDEVLNIGDISLDTKRFTVTQKNKEIYLTRKEFMLLEYLMKNRGTVLSRGMILEHVWDMNADPFSNTIESHIVSIRKKLGSNGKQKMILTIPGRGYKIE